MSDHIFLFAFHPPLLRPAKQTCRSPIHPHLFTLCFRAGMFFQWTTFWRETPSSEVDFVQPYNPSWCKKSNNSSAALRCHLQGVHPMTPPLLRLVMCIVAPFGIRKPKPDCFTSTESTHLHSSEIWILHICKLVINHKRSLLKKLAVQRELYSWRNSVQGRPVRKKCTKTKIAHSGVWGRIADVDYSWSIQYKTYSYHLLV